MYVQGHEIIIVTVIFIALFVLYVRARERLRTLERDYCISRYHDLRYWPQDRAHQCTRCGKWEGDDS